MVGFDEINAQVEAMIAQNPYFIYIILALLVWKLIWYGLAIYGSIKRDQKTWFVVLFVAAFVLNDLGILAIIYLIIYRSKNKRKKK